MTRRSDKGLNPSPNQPRSKNNLAVQGTRGAPRAEDDGNAGLVGRRGIVDTAMRLYQGVPVELNECVEIALSPSISFRANVVWVNGGNCGIAFETQVARSASAVADKQAKELRAPLQNGCAFGGNVHVDDVPIAPNPAPHEMEARHDRVFVPGLRVKVLLGGSPERCAVVHWIRDHIAELVLS